MERTVKPWLVTPIEESVNPKSRQKRDMANHDDIHKMLLDSLSISETKRNRQRDSYRHSASTSTSRERHSRSPTKQSSSSNSVEPSPRTSRYTVDETVRRPALPMTRSEPSVPSTSQTPQTRFSAGSETMVSTNERSSPPPAYEAITDWDVLVSRISTNPESATYEDLLLLEEVSGPAPRMRSSNMGTQDEPFNVSIAPVQLMSRRTTKDGKAKLKLSITDIRVDKCGICLSQFRANESGAFPKCKHCFHEACLRSWISRSPSCPVCRVNLRE